MFLSTLAVQHFLWILQQDYSSPFAADLGKQLAVLWDAGRGLTEGEINQHFPLLSPYSGFGAVDAGARWLQDTSCCWSNLP